MAIPKAWWNRITAERPAEERAISEVKGYAEMRRTSPPSNTEAPPNGDLPPQSGNQAS